MNAGISMLRRAAVAGATVVAATLGVLAQGAPAAAAEAAAIAPIQLPWAASMASAHAQGSYTVAQAPLGVTRTYGITGVLTNDMGGQCYFVKVNGGFPAGQESSRSCGPANPVKISFAVTTVLFVPVSVQVCRGSLVSVGCGPAVRLF